MKANTRIILIAIVILSVATLLYMLSRLPSDNRSTTIPTIQSSPASTVQHVTPTAELTPSSTPIIKPTKPFPTLRPQPTRTHRPVTPAPTFYATLYPFSFDSTDGWSIYTSTEKSISFMYPAEPPRVVSDTDSYGFSFSVRMDPFREAGDGAAISIYENSDSLPLNEFVARRLQRFGFGNEVNGQEPDTELARILKQKGAEDATIYRNYIFVTLTAAATYKGRVYVATSSAPSILRILIRSFRFLP